jgi:hypothetical protein
VSKPQLIALSFLSLFLLIFAAPASEALTSASARYIAYWQNTGNDHVEIGTSGQKLIINITQLANDGAIYNIALSSSNNRTIFQPVASFNTLYISTNETLTEEVTVSNSFGQERVENLPITVTITNCVTQETIGSLTVYATLLPMQNEESPQPSDQQTTQPAETGTIFTQQGFNTNDLVTYFIVFVVVAILLILLLILVLRRSNKNKHK